MFDILKLEMDVRETIRTKLKNRMIEKQMKDTLRTLCSLLIEAI